MYNINNTQIFFFYCRSGFNFELNIILNEINAQLYFIGFPKVNDHLFDIQLTYNICVIKKYRFINLQL